LDALSFDWPARIHLIGGSGTGKTVAADRLAAELGLPVHHLDYEWLDLEASGVLPPGLDGKLQVMAGMAQSIAAEPAWVSEGGFLGWAEPVLAAADIVVWMNVPWRIASYRILSRHVRLTVAGTNRFPGWGRLYRFWRWTAGYYANRNTFGLNPYGTPNSLATLEDGLSRYGDKVVRCEHGVDPVTLLRTMEPV
jgi:hypothetical protein